MRLSYRVDEPPKGVWSGSLELGYTPLQFACRHSALEKLKADVGDRYAFTLDLTGATKFTSGEPIRFKVKIDEYISSDKLIKRNFTRQIPKVKLNDEDLENIAQYLLVTCDGKPVPPKHAIKPKRDWLKKIERPKWNKPYLWEEFTFDIRLDKYFDLAQPGRYTARLMIPATITGGKRTLKSNVLEWLIYATEK